VPSVSLEQWCQKFKFRHWDLRSLPKIFTNEIFFPFFRKATSVSVVQDSSDRIVRRGTPVFPALVGTMAFVWTSPKVMTETRSSVSALTVSPSCYGFLLTRIRRHQNSVIYALGPYYFRSFWSKITFGRVLLKELFHLDTWTFSP
jgi:hypothetical protein